MRWEESLFLPKWTSLGCCRGSAWKILLCKTLLEGNIDVDLASVPRADDLSHAYTHTPYQAYKHRWGTEAYQIIVVKVPYYSGLSATRIHEVHGQVFFANQVRLQAASDIIY